MNQAYPTIIRKYTEVRGQIYDGSLLLRRAGWALDSMEIAAAGRGIHSHSAMALWTRGVLMLAEVREFRGGRCVNLSSQVRKTPGRWDVYWPIFELSWSTPLSCSRWYPSPGREIHTAEIQRVGGAMLHFAGERYGWRNLFRVAGLHVPLIRSLLRRFTKPTGTPFCSHAVAAAWRALVCDGLVPHLPDAEVEPADLARSPYFSYQFTLVP